MAQSFADVLRALSNGQTYEQLGTALTDLVQSVMETGKGGSLTLKLSVKPNGDSIILTDSITAKVPEPTRAQTLFFATTAGHLQRNDPRQGELAVVREVKQAAEE